MDSGALSAIAEKDGVVRTFLENAVKAKADFAIPTVVIVESTTGTSRDAGLNRVISALAAAIVPANEAIARAAGTLRYSGGRPIGDTVDAIVVATADLIAGSAILTGDPGGIASLTGVRARSHAVDFRHDRA